MTSINKISKLLEKATELQEKTFPKKKAEQRLKDYMNDPDYAEFQAIVDDAFIESQKLTASDCVLKTIVFINKLAKKLSDDENHKFTEQMKKWYNKVGI